ncbi:MAG: orc1/cdc6 family replication initiation protein [Candidatus Aenigmarchaeota archaeon]|nr:orc1/cdc6 family replication initiation protein [Candidatus Aenigmarchaeota archaeon]
MYEANTIIKDLRVLTEHFIPRRIIHRTGQLEVLRDNLKPLVNEEIPRSSFLHGPPGTGKTCMSQYIVDELKAHTPVLSAYINCWSYPSRFKILFNILQSLGHNFINRKGTPTDELIDTLKNKIKNRPCIIVLDEADQLEDEKILYDLLEIEKVCIILIANTETLFATIDPRIRSRLQSIDRIEFRPYSTREIFDILKDRADLGLVNDAISAEQLTKIADLSGGDARIALNILRIAAEEAEKKDAEKVSDSHIERAAPKTKNLEADRLLESLNTHQKILYGIVKSSKEISSSDLHEKYLSTCAEKNIEPIVDRTVRKYLERLEAFKLVASSGEGRWTIFKISS